MKLVYYIFKIWTEENCVASVIWKFSDSSACGYCSIHQWYVSLYCLSETCYVYTLRPQPFEASKELVRLLYVYIITLTLKVPITTATDDKFSDIFPNF